MSGKATILLVDDVPANLIALDGLLSNDERLLMTAQSGREALEILDQEKVDLILLDVQMPDMDGFELARILKSKKETAGIPILFASAEKLDRASRMKGLEGGAIDYLLKPLDPEITQAKVTVLLEAQRQKTQLVEKNLLLEKAALLINNSADIIGVIDGETLVVEEMNPAFTDLLGYPPADISGKSIVSFLAEPDDAILKLARSGKDKISFQARMFASDRSLKWFDWKVVVKSGKWFVNARDITEVKQLHTTLEKNITQLESANKELESFSYSVSHDLRAPLRAIHGNAIALEEDCIEGLNEDGRRYLQKVRDNALRMDRLINDLLQFSRMGKKEVRKTNIDMTALVQSIFAEASQSQSHRASVSIGALPEGYGDLSLLQVVWTNLISNAIKYSSGKEDPRIEVGGILLDGEAEYFIKDNGAGFDMAYAGKLFGTFQRLHDSSEFEGVGIGLAIVHRVILKHGGTIRAEAQPEVGATFYFTLPYNGGPTRE